MLDKIKTQRKNEKSLYYGGIFNGKFNDMIVDRYEKIEEEQLDEQLNNKIKLPDIVTFDGLNNKKIKYKYK